MSPNLVYAKTPFGEEAVQQGTRVVQRNLRMVLLQVDGKLNVTELSEKIGNPRLVETALKELEELGLIVGTIEVASFREESPAQPQGFAESVEPRSVFSAFVPSAFAPRQVEDDMSPLTEFSSFGKPIIPTGAPEPAVSPLPAPAPPTEAVGDGVARWRKPMLGIGIVALLLLGGVLFYPYERFKPQLEGSASRFFGAPVTVEKVGVALFPWPQLKLTGVSVGSAGDGRIAEIRIASPFSLLGNGVPVISRVELSGVELSARRLTELPMLSPSDEPTAMLGTVHIEQLTVKLGQQVSIGGLSGDIVLTPSGRMEKAAFEKADRTLLLEARPAGKGVALTIEGRGWEPGGTPLALSSLQAKGVLTQDKLLLQNVDTTFLGGLLRGNWLLDWSAGLAMAGEGRLTRLDSRRVAAVFVPALRLEGEMSGAVRVRSAAMDWPNLWKNIEATIDGEVTQGVLHGVDPFEAARRGSGHEVRAGSLRFSRLQFSIAASPRQTVGRSITVDAGVAHAAGQFTFMPGGQVNGQLNVHFRSSVSSLQMPVHIGGSLPDLVAVSRK